METWLQLATYIHHRDNGTSVQYSAKLVEQDPDWSSYELQFAISKPYPSRPTCTTQQQWFNAISDMRELVGIGPGNPQPVFVNVPITWSDIQQIAVDRQFRLVLRFADDVEPIIFKGFNYDNTDPFIIPGRVREGQIHIESAVSLRRVISKTVGGGKEMSTKQLYDLLKSEVIKYRRDNSTLNKMYTIPALEFKDGISLYQQTWDRCIDGDIDEYVRENIKAYDWCWLVKIMN
jgi:hypothetical protein